MNTTSTSASLDRSSSDPSTTVRRRASIVRTTRETTIDLRLDLDGGDVRVRSGIGMLDHLFEACATHGRLGLLVEATGDLHVDDHHLAEDVGIAFGRAIARTIGDRSGIARFGSTLLPMDESLARCAIDLVERPCAVVDLGLRRESIGTLSCEVIPHVIESIAMQARCTLHLDIVRGENDHHKAEAAFKALGVALAQATCPSAARSTKGTLSDPTRNAAIGTNGVDPDRSEA